MIDIFARKDSLTRDSGEECVGETLRGPCIYKARQMQENLYLAQQRIKSKQKQMKIIMVHLH